MEVVTVQTKNGDWQVRVKPNGHLQIVDPQGRERHCSADQKMTGVHLAMMLSEHTRLDKEENADETLRMRANEFLETE